MPFRLKLRRTRRYNVLSKNYFVTRIRLLDNNVMECTLSVESTGQECLEMVAQRLELLETHYFGLWFQGKTQTPAQRWVELEKPLKKQLDKFGNEPLLIFGVMFYVPSVSRLEQEATRYQYYLQVKKEVLDGRLPCTVERGIRLAGLAVQADFGDFTHSSSQDFLRDLMLFPVNWPNGDEVLDDWTKRVADEHKSHCGMQPAEAELLYIKEVEKLDGFGQESFLAKDNYTNDIFIGVSFIGLFVKHRNGRSIMLHKWKDIGTIAHNKAAITVEITSRDDTINFHMEDMEMAKYIARLFTARHKFYKQNKICTEPTHSPAPIRRRPTWNPRLSLPRPQSCNFQSVHEHYQDTQSSQDSIFHEDPYYKSETSLDRCPVDFAFRNGTVTNGSMYSSPSLSSLNRSQTFIPASPMSSNLSIPGSELMRADFIPSHRHSAIIPPSYRPTPEYDAVMRQKRRLVPAHHDLHSQSLRSLNIINACAYRKPEALVYSQPEIREQGPYHGLGPSLGPYTPQISYSKPVSHGPHTGGPAGSQGHCHSPFVNGGGGSPGGVGSSISHTVSTPDLANTKQGANMGGYAATANMLQNHISRPPPPYPSNAFRPATSTPDLASHRHRCIGGSSPELVTRMVQLSVKTFQPDSSAVVHQSLQEVSEPLTAAAKHRSTLNKRHSMEVITSLRGGGVMEGLALKGMNAPLLRRNTLREHVMPPQPQQPKELAIQKSTQNAPEASVAPPTAAAYQHQKTLSNATMLIHSSESEEEEEEERPELDVQIPGLNEDISISAQLQAALAKLPNKPPPGYPGPPRPPANAQICSHNHNATQQHNHSQEPECNHDPMDLNQGLNSGPNQGGGGGTLTRGDHSSVNGAVLGPSISEPDLTSVKERVRKEPVKERPVSEMFSLEDSIVEREIAQRTLERQKMSVDSMNRPLMMAALNGLYVARMPAIRTPGEDGAKSASDERCKTLELTLEEERVFTEYEQVPKKRASCMVTTATLPENVERNRFRDVVPYEENRVELVPNKENNTGYVNASHIKVMIRGEEWHYIATQGPLAHTCGDFWQMVWEQGVNVIAMVTAEEECGRSKSHRYWPKLGSKHNSATHGKYKVTTKFRTEYNCYATTGLKVKHLLSGQERTVWHLQYTDWPEQGCPEYVPGFLSYLEGIQSVRRHTNSMLDTSKSLNPPVLVHCSAGVGRTGVVILTELMISCLEHNEPVEVPTMLSKLRQQRMLMVQTISQYQFVYQVLIQFLKNSRLI
ncbi:tyrosine-protein phosphatase non-receptor type 14 [Nothobranchius furzeri]|uniref:protein-tyrosine-phosphatase n=2 Tax=Nothobranchius TaxID=28779 RepID=A0A9D2Z3B1_NOTFU|nr:tyrosine-protein phosphatase non-receptor type 14 [Nothobranchius furzeri]XP_015802792.1 tyrosine-protein phosphatase non-receptor type 14 [Nothobranchius furzeri]XP_054603927.1 tyrosine-protein phosphatase non-receptor type 14 [Nothobranchius furzeri]KAF7230612.1 transcript variant X2 [Nothobranchius furzeri]KAF7230613.1 transcript variant X1 [Nothobranchius furzeri]